MMENFTPWSSLVGGILIGLSATMMLVLHGRITGITGIVSGAIDPQAPSPEHAFRWVFILGLLAGAFALSFVLPQNFELGIERSTVALVAAGVLVGWGTRLGSGCTSGHGVCGISRGSVRSLVATLTFIIAGVVTVLVYRAFTGGV